jgi:hypothetical protein
MENSGDKPYTRTEVIMIATRDGLKTFSHINTFAYSKRTPINVSIPRIDMNNATSPIAFPSVK